ncbi:MAG: hypothetical protein F4Y37_09205 [Caldilineaceae bacterium SB0664_bin_22]|nr:hypothetical protein [Caldilineaceae bacterium SB0664_bin_22]
MVVDLQQRTRPEAVPAHTSHRLHRTPPLSEAVDTGVDHYPANLQPAQAGTHPQRVQEHALRHVGVALRLELQVQQHPVCIVVAERQFPDQVPVSLGLGRIAFRGGGGGRPPPPAPPGAPPPAGGRGGRPPRPPRPLPPPGRGGGGGGWVGGGGGRPPPPPGHQAHRCPTPQFGALACRQQGHQVPGRLRFGKDGLGRQVVGEGGQCGFRWLRHGGPR